MDFTVIVGLIMGLAAIVLGQTLEGGHVSSILQSTAAIIVFGGTAGATVLSFTSQDLMHGVRAVLRIVRQPHDEKPELLERLVDMAALARREGLLALENRLESEPNPFLRKALRYVIDGLEPATIRGILEEEVDIRERQEAAGAKVFESAGGFAPTVGIIGAVLGLIHVMEQLTDPSKLGEGIAVAFVATVYGVGSANLILLPIATKIKRKTEAAMRAHAMILDGVLAILEGLNHHLLREKLSVYLLESPGRAAEGTAAAEAVGQPAASRA